MPFTGHNGRHPHPPRPIGNQSWFCVSLQHDDHLYFVASDHTQPDVVVLNLTTVRAFSDSSCVILPDEHPFVAVPSCVAYNFAEIEACATLSAGLARGAIVPHQPFAPALMERVWDGAAVTRHLPLKCRELLKQQRLI